MCCQILSKNLFSVDDHGPEFKTPEIFALKPNAPMAEERRSRRREQACCKA
jgi:hypothetical protein